MPTRGHIFAFIVSRTKMKRINNLKFLWCRAHVMQCTTGWYVLWIVGGETHAHIHAHSLSSSDFFNSHSKTKFKFLNELITFTCLNCLKYYMILFPEYMRTNPTPKHKISHIKYNYQPRVALNVIWYSRFSHKQWL